MQDRFEDITETAFDDETLNAAALPEDGFSTFDDKPQSSEDVLDKSEAEAKQAWKDSGSKLTFKEWVAQQEKRANRKAKWKDVGGTILDIALGWLKGKVDDGSGADEFKDYDLDKPDNRILGLTPWQFAGVSVLVVAGVTVGVVAIVKSKKAKAAASVSAPAV